MSNQPFFVGFNNPRFPYARYGYLPALDIAQETDTHAPESEQLNVSDADGRQADCGSALTGFESQQTLQRINTKLKEIESYAINNRKMIQQRDLQEKEEREKRASKKKGKYD